MVRRRFTLGHPRRESEHEPHRRQQRKADEAGLSPPVLEQHSCTCARERRRRKARDSQEQEGEGQRAKERRPDGGGLERRLRRLDDSSRRAHRGCRVGSLGFAPGRRRDFRLRRRLPPWLRRAGLRFWLRPGLCGRRPGNALNGAGDRARRRGRGPRSADAGPRCDGLLWRHTTRRRARLRRLRRQVGGRFRFRRGGRRLGGRRRRWLLENGTHCRHRKNGANRKQYENPSDHIETNSPVDQPAEPALQKPRASGDPFHRTKAEKPADGRLVLAWLPGTAAARTEGHEVAWQTSPAEPETLRRVLDERGVEAD